MDIGETKIVEFDNYCNRCKHEKKEELDDPCFDCLDEPVNAYTHRPVYFEEKE